MNKKSIKWTCRLTPADSNHWSCDVFTVITYILQRYETAKVSETADKQALSLFPSMCKAISRIIQTEYEHYPQADNIEYPKVNSTLVCTYLN